MTLNGFTYTYITKGDDGNPKVMVMTFDSDMMLLSNDPADYDFESVEAVVKKNTEEVSKILSTGLAAMIAERQKFLQTTHVVDGGTVTKPSKAFIQASTYLRGAINPTWPARVLELRKAFEAEVEEKKKDPGCGDCSVGEILAKYGRKLQKEGFINAEQ